MLSELALLSLDLPVRQRRVLFLRYGLGCSPEETAAASGLAKSSVRKISERALDRLRRAATTAPAKGSVRRRRQPVADRGVVRLRASGTGGSPPRRAKRGAPGFAETLRREGGAAADWMAAVDRFLGSSPYTRATAHRYAGDLAGLEPRSGFQRSPS